MMLLGGLAVGAAEGLATKLIASGMQRVGSLTFQKAIRISRIEQALRTSSLKNPNVKIAINDFQVLIGNRYGEYNERLSAFIDELDRSGLITALVEDAMLDRWSQNVRDSFFALHARAFSTEQGDPADLYTKLMTSFTTTFKELAKDKVTADILKLIHRDLIARCDQIDQALQVLNRSRPAGGLTSLEELRPSLIKIARGLQNMTKQIRVETNKGARSVDISKIYIPPKLSHRDTKKSTETLTKAASAVRGRIRHQGRAEPTEPDWRIDPKVLQTISYSDLKLSFARIVILGDPGGGKSTICQNLCFDLAKQAAGAFAANNKPTAQLQKFPIRIVLRTFEKARTVEPQLSLLDFILRELKNHVSLELDELHDAVQYLLVTGAAVLAFDGLDEILITAQRREFVDLVVSFCNQYPLCPTLVTSRLVGYDDASLTDDFEELILERFDEREILSYLSKFFKVVGGRTEAEAAQFAQVFLRQTAANASDLRTNPLMLGLMAWLFNARGDVPSNRPEIYRECAILMFERWDPDRDIKADVPADFDKLHLFSSVSSQIFGDPELAAGVETSWLSERIREYLESLYENKAQALAASKAIVKFITGRAWVMTDVGDGVFAFTHQTFLEYFFARFVDDKADTVADVLDEIIPHVLRREWDVVAHLSLQIKTHRSLRRQNQATDALIALLRVARPIDEQKALSLFAARSLEYLIASEAQVKALVEIVFAEATTNGSDEQYMRAMQYCAQCSAERRSFVRKLLLELIVKTFRKAEQPAAENLFRAMSDYSFGRRGPSSLLPEDLRTEARSALRKMVVDGASTNRFFATVAWSWYGVISEELIRKHGIATYFNVSLEGMYFGVDGLTSLVLLAHDGFLRPQGFSEERATSALAAVGRYGFTNGSFAKVDFNLSFAEESASLLMWKRLLIQLRKAPEACAGAFFTFLLVSSLFPKGQADNDQSREEDQLVLLSEIKHLVLHMRAVKKLEYYPRMLEMAARSLFGEHKPGQNSDRVS